MRPAAQIALLLSAFMSAPSLAAHAQSQLEKQDKDPCTGKTALFSVLDRPTVKGSACVLQPGNYAIESGYKDEFFTGSHITRLSTYPNTEIRFGLPHHLELKLYPPNYNQARVAAYDDVGGGRPTGFSDPGFGLKYEIGYFGGIVASTELIFRIPSGNYNFGTGRTEAVTRAIVSYGITKHIGVSAQLGIGTFASRANNGMVARYSAFQPDFVAEYHFSDPVPLQFYAEIYGSTTAGPGQEKQFSFDGGIQYLITPAFEVDAEADTLISGPASISEPRHYFGLGLAVLF